MTTADPIRKPWRPRLQFSLRALLVLMALVGAAIVIYRWPWVKVQELSGERISTHYHRSWTGRPVKHGWETVQLYRVSSKRWFEEGDLRLERSFQGEELVGETSWLNGQLHGPYWLKGLVARGHFRNGLQDGRWEFDSVDTTQIEEWKLGKRHGLKTWTSNSGRMLQSAEYDQGRLVKWNGQPVADELLKWLEANVPDALTKQAFVAPVLGGLVEKGVVNEAHREICYTVDVGRHQPRGVLVQWDEILPASEQTWEGKPVGECILEQALENSRTLAFRYGQINVVPITAAEVAWHDRTGVYDIKFAPGSDQERFWLGLTIASPYRESHPTEIVRNLFHPNPPSPIELDTGAIDALEPPYLGPGPITLPHYPRIRRDLVGEHLDRAGYYCELNGNTLVIKPHADHPMRRKKR